MTHPFEETRIRNRISISTQYRKAAIVIIAVVLASGFLFLSLIDNEPFDGTLTHQLDIWTDPKDYSFEIVMRFYLTEVDAENSVDRLIGTAFTIAPGSDGHYTIYLHNIPLTSSSVWVYLFCRYESGVETDAVIEELTISVSKVFQGDAPEITLRLSVFQ